MVFNMKLALIGANGKVGTELCFLLKNEVEGIKPIIRNNLGAVFLKFHGFNCTIADIQEKDLMPQIHLQVLRHNLVN